MSTPAHRATVAFLRAGLVAIVALLASGRLGWIARDAPALALAVRVLQLLVPIAGFAAAGAIGGAALGRGRRVTLAFAAGCLLAGLVLSVVWPQLSGLTGHENLALVVSFAVLSWALAFCLAGLVGGAAIGSRHMLPVASAFAAGGALGGLLLILPVLLTLVGLHDWPPLAQQAITLFSSVVGLLVPFAVGGAGAGRAVDADAPGG